MKSRSIFNVIVGLGVFAIAHSSSAETFVFTGGGTDANWSNPLNWQDGTAPISSSDTILDFSQVHWGEFVNDISADFEVGELIGAGVTWPGADLFLTGQPIRVHHSVTNLVMRSWNEPLIRIHNAILNDTVGGPVYNNGLPRGGSALGGVVLDGSIDVTGGWRIDGLTGTGSIHLNQDASLDSYIFPTSLNLHSLTGEGWFDLRGNIYMIGGVPADLTEGVLDLGRNDQTIGGNQTASVNFNGDVDLGTWLLCGPGSTGHGQSDVLNVTGELDLSQASFHPDSYIHADFWGEPVDDHVVIASYGNRIGSFPDVAIPFSLYEEFEWIGNYSGQIIYTNGENAGPGEIWVVIPEPVSILPLAILIPLTLRGRR